MIYIYYIYDMSLLFRHSVTIPSIGLSGRRHGWSLGPPGMGLAAGLAMASHGGRVKKVKSSGKIIINHH